MSFCPSNFALLEQKNIVQVLEEIARQARCAIWLNGNTFYLRYLPEEPTATITISQSDIVPKSMEVFHTDTEDLVTKLTAEWRPHYAVDEPNKVILQHNVRKYGTHEKTEEYYIYNQVIPAVGRIFDVFGTNILDFIEPKAQSKLDMFFG